MNNKNNTITIRLNNHELSIVNLQSNKLNISKSEYIRSLITNKKPVEVDYRQEIVPILGKIFVMLQALGLDDSDIIREVHKLCQKLS